MSVLPCIVRGLVLLGFGGVLAIGMSPSAGWASCLWVDMRRMDPPNPSRDGLIVAANQCDHEMRFAFGEWNPKNGKLDTWTERLAADGDTGNVVFLSVKPNYYLLGTPCQSDCMAEQDDFRARRTFNPAQTVIWIPRAEDPPG